MNVALVAQEAGDQALAQLGLVLDFMGEVIGVGQVHPVLPPQCITGAAGQVGEALVEVDDAVGGRVDQHDAQVGLLEHRAPQRFRLGRDQGPKLGKCERVSGHGGYGRRRLGHISTTGHCEGCCPRSTCENDPE
jgi:hypothetical protein